MGQRGPRFAKIAKHVRDDRGSRGLQQPSRFILHPSIPPPHFAFRISSTFRAVAFAQPIHQALLVSLAEIKDAVEALTPNELTELASFILERDNALWDRQIDADFAEGGRLRPLLDGVRKRRPGAGTARAMEERKTSNVQFQKSVCEDFARIGSVMPNSILPQPASWENPQRPWQCRAS